jgi:uncharacterized protein YprB with RNaseH-like and TPR domain
MDLLHEYDVVRDGNVFKTNFSDRYVWSSEYEHARQQIGALQKKYEGAPIGSVLSGTEETNDAGVCFRLNSRQDFPALVIDSERYRHDILADLTLVKGIGEATRRQLNARGYKTIADLTRHPRFRATAARALGQLSGGNSLAVMDFLGSRHATSHPLVLGAAGFHDPEDYVFLDIETLGLFSRPIILLGIGTIENGHLAICQYLLRGIEEEQAALYATLGHLSGDNPALVTFNGKSFDFPYLKDRLSYYGMDRHTRIAHFDVLHFSRRRWKGTFPSLRLTALEQEILGIRRDGDIPGQMVPEFYETYLRTGNCGPLIPVVEHNRQDVISLALLFCYLLLESYGC